MISGTGIWSLELRFGDPPEVVDAVTELEDLGYTAVWIPDGGGDGFEPLERLLAATTTTTVATGVQHPAADGGRHECLVDEPIRR